MKTQHQNPEFGHTQGEIRKKHIKEGVKLRKPSILCGGGGLKLSFILSFVFPERFHCCCCIYFHCSYLYNYYNCSQTYAEFQHFILRSNQIFILQRTKALYKNQGWNPFIKSTRQKRARVDTTQRKNESK